MVDLLIKDDAKLRVEIAKTGMNLKMFANHIDISSAYLSQILNGNRNPSPTVANKIANGLNMNIEDIFLIQTVAKVNQI